MSSVSGIILMGGKSSRMGADKSTLVMHGQYMYQIAAEKIQPFCEKVYLSINPEQNTLNDYPYSVIVDKYMEQGPIGGLVSCHRHIKDTLLVIACDLPFISMEDISMLLSLHTKEQGCTMFYNQTEGYYEPMLSIWEPSMLDSLSDWATQGGRSLQRFLKEKKIFHYSLPPASNFTNFNSKEEWERIK